MCDCHVVVEMCGAGVVAVCGSNGSHDELCSDQRVVCTIGCVYGWCWWCEMLRLVFLSLQ